MNKTLSFAFLLFARIVTFVVFCAAATLPMAAQSVGLAPALVVLDFKPGRSFATEISVMNQSDHDLEMKGSVADLWYNDKNETTFPGPGTSEHSAANWVEIVPRSFTVAAHSTTKVKLIVTPPEHVMGGRYATVFIETKPTPMQSKDDNQRIFANFRLGAFLMLTAENSAAYDVQVGNAKVTPPASDKNFNLDFEVSNLSNTHVLPEAQVVIVNKQHDLVAKTSSEMVRFMPGQKKRMALSWAGSLPPGDYTALLSLMYAPGKVVTKEFPFTTQ